MGEGDKAGLAAIKALHHQLDDDHDGTIEPQETGDFIKADLKVIVRMSRISSKHVKLFFVPNSHPKKCYSNDPEKYA